MCPMTLTLKLLFLLLLIMLPPILFVFILDQDIRLRDEANLGNSTKLHRKAIELQSHISYCIRYSLRVTLPTFNVIFPSVIQHHLLSQ